MGTSSNDLKHSSSAVSGNLSRYLKAGGLNSGRANQSTNFNKYFDRHTSESMVQSNQFGGIDSHRE